MNPVQMKNFSTWYGKQAVLKRISVEVKPRSITAIVGPSGCGKTTLLRSINRTAEIEKGFRYSGEIKVFNQSIYQNKDASMIRRRVGMVYQTPVALPLSIKENILFGPRYYGVKKRSEQEQIVEECLRRVALWEEVKDRLPRPASQLSGGQKQRLAIARVLAVDPQILLLDEPCSSLDPSSTRLIEELLERLAQQLSILIVTHNLFQARRIAKDTLFMLDGKIIEHGPTEELFTSPQNEATQGFFAGDIG